MPRGDKSAYTDKQKRKASKIEASYRERGVSEKTAERRAWATVNKQDGGGLKKRSSGGRKGTSGRSRSSSSSSSSSRSSSSRSRGRSKASGR